MEKKNNKTLILTAVICLLPMILGIAFYNRLPEQMPIHFTIGDIPDSYANKNIVVFGFPIFMAIFQTILLILVNLKAQKLENKNKPRIAKIMEWFIPILTIVAYIITIETSLGSTVYIGKSICLVLGILFIIIGNYVPKVNYEYGKDMFHPSPKNEKSFRKMCKFTGYSFIGIGILLLILMIWV